MLSKLSFAHLKWSGQAPPGSELWRFACYARDSQPDFPKSRFKLVGQSLGDRWKLNGIKPGDPFSLLIPNLPFLFVIFFFHFSFFPP